MIELSNLREVPVGTRVKTTKGFAWKLIVRNKDGETWLDETSGLHWMPIEKGKFNHAEAMKLEVAGKFLPTKEEFKEAELRGIREIIDMNNKWFWTSSVNPGVGNYAYYFYGNGGQFGNYYRYYGNGATMLVSR